MIDAKLLETLETGVADFAGGAGNTMLAYSPKKPLPDLVMNRPKTGLLLPIATWLSDATYMRTGSDLPMLTAPGTLWARTILAEITECG